MSQRVYYETKKLKNYGESISIFTRDAGVLVAISALLEVYKSSHFMPAENWIIFAYDGYWGRISFHFAGALFILLLILL